MKDEQKEHQGFDVRISSPLGVEFEGRVVRVDLMTDKGPTTILAKHQPSIMVIESGRLSYEVLSETMSDATRDDVVQPVSEVHALEVEEGTCIIDPHQSVKIIVYKKKNLAGEVS